MCISSVHFPVLFDATRGCAAHMVSYSPQSASSSLWYSTPIRTTRQSFISLRVYASTFWTASRRQRRLIRRTTQSSQTSSTPWMRGASLLRHPGLPIELHFDDQWGVSVRHASDFQHRLVAVTENYKISLFQYISIFKDLALSFQHDPIISYEINTQSMLESFS